MDLPNGIFSRDPNRFSNEPRCLMLVQQDCRTKAREVMMAKAAPPSPGQSKLRRRTTMVRGSKAPIALASILLGIILYRSDRLMHLSEARFRWVVMAIWCMTGVSPFVVLYGVCGFSPQSDVTSMCNKGFTQATER